MNSRHRSDWAPSPELLAAYFDGEFEGRDDLALLRQRLEDWLARRPRAREELAAYHRLRELWSETTPSEPSSRTWARLLADIESERAAPAVTAKKPKRAGWTAAALLAGAACLAAATFLLTREKPLQTLPEQPPLFVQDEEPFPVATESEVVVLRVEGEDTGSLVVGTFPLQGPLELAGPGDVTFGENSQVHVGGSGRPMVWARLDPDE
jgi:hypothetical protein